MVVTSRRTTKAAATLLLSVVVAGCGSTSVTAGPPTAEAAPSTLRSPAGPPVLGLDWGRAASVARPEDAFAAPSPGASFAFSLGGNRSGHPLHFPGQAMMADVAVLPSGGLASVGYVYPGWHPTSWTSADGRAWDLHPIADTEFTFPVAIAVGANGHLVAVGRSGSSPLAWTSTNGMTWTPHPVAILGDGTVAERMTSVVTTSDGFIAGGSVGPELLDRHARFWTSADGIDWHPVPDDPAALAESEVRAIARLGDGYVATGITGSVQDITGSTAWTSRDGRTWTRRDDQALSAGRAIALATPPWGGIVAVGSDRTEDEALAWTSTDGVTWTLAPSEPSRQYYGKIRMTDVTVAGGELIAIGNYVGVQRGTATSWVSTDGLHWQKARVAPIQQQIELYAIAAAGPGVVAVGSFGAPDDYIPTVLLSPGR